MFVCVCCVWVGVWCLVGEWGRGVCGFWFVCLFFVMFLIFFFVVEYLCYFVVEVEIVEWFVVFFCFEYFWFVVVEGVVGF